MKEVFLKLIVFGGIVWFSINAWLCLRADLDPWHNVLGALILTAIADRRWGL